MNNDTMSREYYEGSTILPLPGPDGHAYMALGGKRGWFRTYNEAVATGATTIVQRCLQPGRRYGSEWTVKA